MYIKSVIQLGMMFEVDGILYQRYLRKVSHARFRWLFNVKQQCTHSSSQCASLPAQATLCTFPALTLCNRARQVTDGPLAKSCIALPLASLSNLASHKILQSRHCFIATPTSTLRKFCRLVVHGSRKYAYQPLRLLGF